MDQISKSILEPICVTKNGEEYLYILNPILFRSLVQELEYEKEINLILARVHQAKNDVEAKRVERLDDFMKRK